MAYTSSLGDQEVSDPQRGWAEAVIDRIDFRGDETVLDAGCGSGDVTRGLALAAVAAAVPSSSSSPAAAAISSIPSCPSPTSTSPAPSASASWKAWRPRLMENQYPYSGPAFWSR